MSSGSPSFPSLASHSSLLSLRTPAGTPTFVNLNPMYKCPQCTLVLRDAVQLLCGHHVCQNCVDPLFGQEEVKICQFDDCGFEISKSQTFPDACRRREILQLKVYCPHESCGAKVAWKDLEGHTNSCEYRRVACRWSVNGCNANIVLKNQEYHEKQECQYISIQCDECLQELPKIRLQDHLSSVCPMVIEECPFGCNFKAQRREIQDHKNSCPNRPKPCSFSCIGCDFTGDSSAVDIHEKEELACHIEFVKNYAQNMETKNLQLHKELQELKSEKQKWESRMQAMEVNYNDLKKDVASFKLINNELKLTMVTQREKMIVLERKVDGISSNQQIESLTRETNTLKQSLAEALTRISALEQNPAQGGAAASNPQVSTQIKTIEKQTSLHDIRLAELDLRFQILETANYNGELMWKIRDYSRRLREAKQGKTLSLFSQPFYTSKHGYKMCGRVYLNGDGVGKGRHLSFFFVVMRGDFDNLLPWPFRQRVSLMLLDQNDRTQNICDTFNPDPTSNSFKKPTTEMNVASGVPCFIEQSKLATRTFLHDDTIFLKIKVDCSNLP